MRSRAKLIGTAVVLAIAVIAAGRLYRSPHSVRAQASLNVAESNFSGTWNWMFQDRRFATMILNLQDGRFSGSITNGSLNMDKNGKITNAMAAEGSSPILRASLEKGVLHIVEKDGGEETEWAMTLISETTAELRMAGAGVPANAEPIRLEKVWSEPPVEN